MKSPPPSCPARPHPLRDLASWGLQLRFWVALCVTSLAVFAHRIETNPASPGETLSRSPLPIFGVIFLATLALYNLDGSLDAPSHGSDTGSRRRIHWLLTLLSLAGLTWTLAMLPLRAQALTVMGFAFSGIYALPLTFRWKMEGLKSLPGVKGPFVGLAVAVAVVWVPALSSPRTIAVAPLFLLCVVLALYCTANALLFDIPDIRIDSQRRIPTLVRRFGVLGVQRICITLCTLGLLIWPIGANLLAFFVGRPWQSRNMAALSALGICLLWGSFRTRRRTSRTQVAFLVDGALLLPVLIQSIVGT